MIVDFDDEELAQYLVRQVGPVRSAGFIPQRGEASRGQVVCYEPGVVIFASDDVRITGAPFFKAAMQATEVSDKVRFGGVLPCANGCSLVFGSKAKARDFLGDLKLSIVE